MSKPLIADFFDEIFVINLKRRPDRLQSFFRQWEREPNFPSNRITVIEAVDGREALIPEWYMPNKTLGERQGAWGCLQSHLSIWRRALERNDEQILIFEDDCQICRNFTRRLSQSLSYIPPLWNFLYLGGQLLRALEHPPCVIGEQIFYVYNVNRTHSYGIHRSILSRAYTELSRTDLQGNQHLDYQLGYLHQRSDVTTLAILPWLTRQSGSRSDIWERKQAKTNRQGEKR